MKKKPIKLSPLAESILWDISKTPGEWVGLDTRRSVGILIRAARELERTGFAAVREFGGETQVMVLRKKNPLVSYTRLISVEDPKQDRLVNEAFGYGIAHATAGGERIPEYASKFLMMMSQHKVSGKLRNILYSSWLDGYDAGKEIPIRIRRNRVVDAMAHIGLLKVYR